MNKPIKGLFYEGPDRRLRDDRVAPTDPRSAAQGQSPLPYALPDYVIYDWICSLI